MGGACWQDLLREGCISEPEYHATKQPILSRLAEQGAELDSQDFVMLVSPLPQRGSIGHDAPDCRATVVTTGVETATEKSSSSTTIDHAQNYSPGSRKKKMAPADASTTTRKTPIKQVLEAMSRIKNNRANWYVRKCIFLWPFVGFPLLTESQLLLICDVFAPLTPLLNLC